MHVQEGLSIRAEHLLRNHDLQVLTAWKHVACARLEKDTCFFLAMLRLLQKALQNFDSQSLTN